MLYANHVAVVADVAAPLVAVVVAVVAVGDCWVLESASVRPGTRCEVSLSLLGVLGVVSWLGSLCALSLKTRTSTVAVWIAVR